MYFNVLIYLYLIKDKQNAAKMKKDFYGGMSYLIFSQTPKH